MPSIRFNQRQLELAGKFIFANNTSCSFWPVPVNSELDVINNIVDTAKQMIRDNLSRGPDEQIYTVSTGGYTVLVDDEYPNGTFWMSVLVDPGVSQKTTSSGVIYEIDDEVDD